MDGGIFDSGRQSRYLLFLIEELEMIFKYGSKDFEQLKDSLRKILIKNINDTSLDQDKRNLMGVLYRVLDEDNIETLKKLNNINLKFNSWSNTNDSLNNNLLSAQNSFLLSIYNQDESAFASFNIVNPK